jgi:hypothetical protein
MFVNVVNNKVLDVTGGKDAEGQAVIVWNKHGKVNQRWNIIYVDKAKPVQDEGLNKDFGFHINRPFYIRSRLPMKRVAENHGNNAITLRRWRNNVKQQQWWFDGESKTVRNNNWKARAMEIPSNGGANDLRTNSVNSRWW